MGAPSEMSDVELRAELKQHGFDSGPITESTRSVLEKKLIKMRSQSSTNQSQLEESMTRPNEEAQLPSPSNSIGPLPPTQSTHLPQEKPNYSALTAEGGDADFQFKFTSLSIELPKHQQPELQQRKPLSHFPHQQPTTSSGQQGKSSSTQYRRSSVQSILNNSSINSSSYLQDDQPKMLPKACNPYGSPVTTHRKVLRNESLSNSFFEPNDFPKLLLIVVGSFFAVLLLAYVIISHSDAIVNFNRRIISYFTDADSLLYDYAILPSLLFVFVLGFASVVFFVWRRRINAQILFKQRTSKLIDKIIDVVREAGDAGISEAFAMEEILPPPNCRSSYGMELWRAAAEFIKENDTRIRTETCIINGVESTVWTWISIGERMTLF